MPRSAITELKDKLYLSQKALWLLGFFLVVNVHLIPWLTKSPRATDLIGVILGAALFIRFTVYGLRLIPLTILFVLALVPVAWGIYALGVGDWDTAIRTSRWLVALPWAYMLYFASRKPEGRYALVLGMWWGVMVNLGVVLLQFAGYGTLMRNIGLAAQDEQLRSVYGLLRPPGMHGGPNASMAVISLTVPLSLVLFYEYGKSVKVVLIGLAILVTGTAITLTRSSALVAAITLAIVFLFNLRLRRSFKLITFLLVALIVVILTLGPPGGWKRWTDIERLQTNINGRVYTNFLSLQLSIRHPFGIGNLQREELVGATHNAFLQASLEYGLLFGIFIFCLMLTMALRVLWGLRRAFGFEGILALHITGLFMFEEHLNNPTFIILSTWVAISAIEWIRLILKRFPSKQKQKVLSHG